MLEIFDNSEKKDNIIIFIHGFIGGETTWKNNTGSKLLIPLIFSDPEIAKNFNYGLFIYHTELIELFAQTRRLIKKGIKGEKATKNLPVNALGNILGSEIRFKCKKYKNVILVGHSMGGLVAKRFVLNDLKKNIPSKVKLYISLATPHLGSNLATYGKKIIDNYQVEDLAPLSDNITKLSAEWIKCDFLPKRLYCMGYSDEVVPVNSAVAFDKEDIEPVYTDNDHFSIIKPENENDTIVVAIQEELKDLLSELENEKKKILRK